MIDPIGTVPLFIEQGELFAAHRDLDPEHTRNVEDAILTFAATWEALNLIDLPITDAAEVHDIGTWPTTISQDAYLRRLSD